MDELQLKLCDIQGRLFELSAEKKLPSASFIKAFMTSETAKELDSRYNRMQWMGEEYLLEEVLSSAGNALSGAGEVYQKDVLYWIGYIYRYWHYYLALLHRRKQRKDPASSICRHYETQLSDVSHNGSGCCD